MNEKANKLVVEVMDRKKVLTNADRDSDKSGSRIEQEPKTRRVRNREADGVAIGVKDVQSRNVGCQRRIYRGRELGVQAACEFRILAGSELIV